ncbi:AAA family ATPase [Acinetobacter gyllenbergii]|uniref:AAA family ATPase n=1 Tax=Acinetobacter gyllenbergii TaxID=134534 RepID=UPI0004034E47|nr:ATP-binding protein [Acinetobacter gyllenbergii]
MSVKVERILIEKLFDNKNIDWELKDVNVLVGKNGSGKTTILQLINAAILNDLKSNSINLCHSVSLYLNKEKSDGKSITLVNPLALKTHAKNFYKTKENHYDNMIENQIKDALNKTNIKNINLDIINSLKSQIKSSILQDIENDKNIEIFFNKKLKENFSNLSVEYISTINMSANSINNITKSDGKNTNFLDYEIREELNKLLNSNNQNNKKNLINVLNSMFSDSNKKVEIKNNNLLFKLDNGKIIGYNSLSSGERQVIYIFIKVINASVNNALILMDEPEISLHLSWQEKLISQIRQVNKTSQIIIVTHSPAIVMNGWMDSFIDIKDILVEKESD